MSKTSMEGPLGGTDRDLGAPFTYVGDANGGPQGGVVRVPGAPTTYVRDVNGGCNIPCFGNPNQSH
jgi:hypothetical protein